MKHNAQHIINAAALANIGERVLVGIAMLRIVFVPCLSILADCSRALRNQWQAMMNRDAIRQYGSVAIIKGILGAKAAPAVHSVTAPSVVDYAGTYFVTFYVKSSDKQIKQ